MGLSDDVLSALNAKYCDLCGGLRSAIAGGHRCTGRPSQPQPAHAQAQQPAQEPGHHEQPAQQRVVSAHGQPGRYAAMPGQTVPRGAHEQWGRAVARAAEEFLAAVDRGAERGIVDAVDALLQLPGRTLNDSGASRGRLRRTRARLERAANGVDPDADAQQRPRRAMPPQHKKAKRMHRLLTLGSITRAARCLEALPIVDPTEEVLAVLRALHPQSQPPVAPEPTTGPVQVTEETFTTVLQALPKGSCPGPSGWTYEHIKAATASDNNVRSVAIRLINCIVGGALPHLPALLDSTLIGLEKPGGRGVRPIAIGEVWLRLAGLCAMASCPGAGQALAPLQLGVGIRGGAQCIGHALKAGIAADPDRVTLQMDWTNAFNSLQRKPMLDAIAERQPTLLPFATWVYRQPSRLFVSGAPEGTPPIMSECGVRQGDPCGPLYFALTLQGPLESMSRRYPEAPGRAYLDDSFLQGRAEHVIRAFPALCDLGAAIGLVARPDKCGVYSANVQAAAEVAQALGIAHCTAGLMVAGTPIGTDEFITEHARAKADATCRAIDQLLELPLPAQDQFIILRSSLQMRVAHLPRVMPWDLAEAAVRRVEDKTASAAFRIAQRPEQQDRRQLTLPLRFGGMGILATSSSVANAAYLSAAAMTETAMRAGAPQFRPFAGPSAEGLTQMWQALHAEGAGHWPEGALEVNQECIDDVLPGVQRVIGQLTAARKHEALLASFSLDSEDGVRNLARLRSCASRPASIWLDTLPTAPSLCLSDSAFACGLRHRLGLSHMPCNAPGVQCFCGHSMQAGSTDHAMTCSTLSGAKTLRHDIIKDIWRRIAHRAGVTTSVEPVLRPLRGAQAAALTNRQEARGDILLVLNPLTVADVSVIHPAAATYARDAARTQGAAAANRDVHKRARYELSNPDGYAFRPLSIESYGHLGKPAMELLNTLASTAAEGGTVRKDHFVSNALRELSVGLCRGNAEVYRRSMTALARASGNAFRAGMTVATAEVD